ncbi:hypothetical protein IV102_05565 [bacterium]|nr:hypothetical protein [bacterium]
MSVEVFGIRHHGPGSAASLVKALQDLQPDIVLLEGPPDGDAVAALAGHADMQPPVALLIYPSDRIDLQGKAAYYPFAHFSPEWNALRYALERQIPVRFIDLPQSHQMALDLERVPGKDPFEELARAAGYPDGERCWEMLVEQQADGQIFAGILEAMTLARQQVEPASGREALREAWMRRSIRQAQKEGHQRLAVVCGAWHAPVLIPGSWPSASHDDGLLRGLPKCKVEATWVPWTYDRLSFTTGYGAGVDSPEYYHLLWEHSHQDVAVRWMVSAAQLLRAEDLPASPAGAVEAVRLAQTLAALRGQPMTALVDLLEAARAVFCQGADTPMQLIHKKLVLGERLGNIPQHSPQLPLARDLAALQKRLRLAPEAAHRDLELDLRKPNDLERSRLLHRLNLLEVNWGELRQSRGSGTFRESWRLQWAPEFALDLVQAARWGNTVQEASQAFVAQRAPNCPDLANLTELAEQVLLADLPQALDAVLAQLQARAALSHDPGYLLDTLPPFARILRYPDVRQTDANMLRNLVGGLMERVAIGLPLACASLDDEAAEAMFKRLQPAQSALLTLDVEEWHHAWRGALLSLANQQGMHGLVAGRASWILLDVGQFSASEASRRLGLALSRAIQATQAAAWVEGFLRDNGELLVHTPELFQVIDQWICQLEEERFTEVLPLLRRTFASFPTGVRRNLGQSLKRAATAPAQAGTELDQARVALVLPLLRQILGVPHE